MQLLKSLLGLAVVLLLVAIPAAAQDTTTPTIEVSDQAIEDGMVTVDRVVSDGPGWLVIHADDNGSPGQVLGQSAVVDGENLDVQVEIDEAAATDTLHAMLHSDLGVEGTYEFPGADVPAQVDGQVVLASFAVTGMMQETATPAATATEAMTPTVGVAATQAVTTTPGVGATQEPGTLPETGGSSTPWTPIVLVGMGLVLVAVGSLWAWRRSTSGVDIDR